MADGVLKDGRIGMALGRSAKLLHKVMFIYYTNPPLAHKRCDVCLSLPIRCRERFGMQWAN